MECYWYIKSAFTTIMVGAIHITTTINYAIIHTLDFNLLIKVTTNAAAGYYYKVVNVVKSVAAVDSF